MSVCVTRVSVAVRCFPVAPTSVLIYLLSFLLSSLLLMRRDRGERRAHLRGRLIAVGGLAYDLLVLVIRNEQPRWPLTLLLLADSFVTGVICHRLDAGEDPGIYRVSVLRL